MPSSPRRSFCSRPARETRRSYRPVACLRTKWLASSDQRKVRSGAGKPNSPVNLKDQTPLDPLSLRERPCRSFRKSGKVYAISHKSYNLSKEAPQESHSKSDSAVSTGKMQLYRMTGEFMSTAKDFAARGTAKVLPCSLFFFRRSIEKAKESTIYHGFHKLTSSRGGEEMGGKNPAKLNS